MTKMQQDWWQLRVTICFSLSWLVALPELAAAQQQQSSFTPPSPTPELDETAHRQLEEAQQLWGDSQQTNVEQERANLIEESERLYQQAFDLHEAMLRGAFEQSDAVNTDTSKPTYQDVIALVEQSLKLQEQVWGLESLRVADTVVNLAALYQNTFDFERATHLLQRALAIYEKHQGGQSPEVAVLLNNLAVLQFGQSHLIDARQRLEQSLSIWENLSREGQFYPQTTWKAWDLTGLVIGMKTKSRFDNPYLTTVSNMAEFYKRLELDHEAEQLLKQVLTAVKSLAPRDEALILEEIGLIYRQRGNTRQAALMLERSLNLQENEFKPDGFSRFFNRLPLMVLYEELGDYQRAIALLEEISVSEDDPFNQQLRSLILEKKADLYAQMGDYNQAISLLERVLASAEQFYRAEHQQVAVTLRQLARLYRFSGSYRQAEQLLGRSQSIQEQFYASEEAQAMNGLPASSQPFLAYTLSDLADVYQAQDELKRTIELRAQSLDIEENYLAQAIRQGVSPQLLAQGTLNPTFSTRGESSSPIATTNKAISLNLQTASDNLQAARLALTTLLRRKGRLLELEVNQAQSLRQNLTTEDQALLDQLIAARSRLAQLIFNKPKALSIEDYRLQVATLQAEISELENRLFKQQVNSDTALEPVTIEAVQQAIPERTALVEWVRYTPFNPKAKSADKEWGSPRYAAYILYSQGEPRWVDLGEAEAIEQAVLAFGRALRNPIRLPPVKQSGRTLDALIMQPVRELLAENTDHLLLSPDSQLNLIPFAALVDERDRYLVEAYRLTYLTSGRDLLRLQHSIPSSQVPVFFANPDYERPGQPPEEVRLATSKPGEENQRSAELANLQFDSLPGTAEEADAITLLLPEAILLTQSQATENALKQVQSPRLLHIATHGFFLKDVQPPTSSVTLPSPQVVPTPGNSNVPETSSNSNVNPLLRSGLALAGFNPRKSSGEDGVLTAFEATGLNLLGTQLVVLSACETGLGDVVNGEGVYGLRRAFVIAGAESQMISLWKVSDSGTKDLMSAYYQKLLTGEGRSEALQKTQLELLQIPKYRHPYYWAAFIFSGNWKSLESP